MAIFNGELDPPLSITCKNFHDDVLGWCLAPYASENVHLGIKRASYTRKLFFTILVHEMVHQWEQKSRKNMAHGKYFNSWKPIIEDVLGLPLSTLVRLEDFLGPNA